MHFGHSDKTRDYIARLEAFMAAHIYPNEPVFARQLAAFGADRWQVIPVIEELKPLARRAGLWNLFMPPGPTDHAGPEAGAFGFDGPLLTNLEYAPLAEIMGRVLWASEVFNCSAPDTGNMEVLQRYGSLAQKREWLAPLMNGDIRSAFLMTEPGVASSDAANIETDIRREGDDYVINGVKWWSSGAGDPRCKIAILMGKTDRNAHKYSRQSQILVPLDAPGVTRKRFLPVFGYDDAPHGHYEIGLENVRVPAENLILGEGRGFEIAQGRLGPGRIHHCMRTIGAAERALELMCERLLSRTAFGKRIAEHSIWEQRIADARVEIDMTRLLCLKAAWMMDEAGNKVARAEIAMIKVAAPRMALKVIDDAIQAFGGAGVSEDVGLARAYAGIRTLRLADGPDEVHCRTIARIELGKAMGRMGVDPKAMRAAAAE